MPESPDVWMRRALELAERGRGFVEPNPLVGAVLVKDGRVVGEGWHEVFGSDHAEVNAIRRAGSETRGATLYVTLEPCCHHGKTPPCTDLIRSAGIAAVVAAMQDPFPKVAGQGATILRDSGIPVDIGLREDEAKRQNAPYLTLLSKKRPYVHGKWAMSLDGKIATRTGESKWISGNESRRRVHDLRGRMDAILVGIGTALADDPLLTARPLGPRSACRVVLDRRARLPTTSQLVKSAKQFPTLVFVGESADRQATSELREKGCEIIAVRETNDGRLDVRAVLLELGGRNWTNLLVEGGGDVLGSFSAAGLLDELHVFIAPTSIGGCDAPGPLGGVGPATLREAGQWSFVESRMLGDDVYLRAVAGGSALAGKALPG